LAPTEVHAEPLKISFVVPPAADPMPSSSRPNPLPVVEVPAPAPAPERIGFQTAESFVPTILSSKERFIEFALDIYALASRLSSSHSERYLADQLLRTSMSVGARLTDSRSAETRAEFMAL